jgi:gliding motility-associated-like protein
VHFLKPHILLIVSIFFFSSSVFSQSYFANGDARAIGGQCYELTPASGFKLGSVWYADKLDISKDFDLEFYLNFGSLDANGADGIVFVMQTVGNRALGQAGGGLGFEGFSPSLGIEFDTWQNIDAGDPSNDHIAIFKNGNVNHSGTNQLRPAVSALPGGLNIEDGKDHLIRIRWNATGKRLDVWFDCNLRQTLFLDIQSQIFSGTSQVFWGFTAATGGSVNKQVACLRDDILIPDTMALCKGDSIQLNARESANNSYKWTPSLYLNDTTLQKPTCSAIVPMTYYLEYTDLCNNVLRDTIHVRIDQPFKMDEGRDTLLCDGKAYSFDLNAKYDSVLWNTGSTQRFIQFYDSGFYKLRAWKGVCYDDDSFRISINNSPNIVFDGQDYFCDGDSALVTITVTPDDAVYYWADGPTTVTSRYFTESINAVVTATNSCGTVVKNKQVVEIIFDPFDLGEGRLLCEGDTAEISVPLYGPWEYLWSNGDQDQTTKIYEAGAYWFRVFQNECFASDTISFTYNIPPVFDFPEEIILCNRERLMLNANLPNASVNWNNGTIGDSYLLTNFDGVLDVKASNDCGEDSAQIDVSLVDCYCILMYGNAFTPNEDNLNETFKPVVDCTKLERYKLSIYNRWGEKLFETTQIDQGWDGYYKGVKVQQDVYTWIAEYAGYQNGNVQKLRQNGVVHVIY